MDTEDAASSVDAPAAPASHVLDRSPVEDGSRKRKASSGRDLYDDYAKRARQGSRSPPPPSRPSASPGGGPADRRAARERRESAAQEEKQRGKRLFSGLLNTLSQSASSSQNKRRQEIEQRQVEKMQQQTAEDDKLRAERRAALQKTRIEQQIVWEEQVMRSRHAKSLRLAQFLRTTSEPAIYYLSRRLSHRDEDIIHDQVRETKARIARELEDFKWHKEQHVRRYGPRTERDATPPEQSPAPAPEVEPEAEPDAEPPSAPEPPDDVDEAKQPLTVHNPHDDSSDMLVEGEEDMVIY